MWRWRSNLASAARPVRMALARLESEGWSKRVPHRGWFAFPLTSHDIQELFDLKELLEPLAARRAAERITPETAAASWHQRGDETGRSGAKPGEMVRGGSPLPRSRLCDSRQRSTWADRATPQQPVVPLPGGLYHAARQMDLLWEEHHVVAQAIAAGDADRAAENSRGHINTRAPNCWRSRRTSWPPTWVSSSHANWSGACSTL